ncbi:hypothetical protein BHF71_07260 [Vulcanibacillus modesticaldus]|uniref:Lipoprotein n=1 Tax=Vulcanibacillus modesticaldus TaxID=337097 RepID=A0A1D2YW22_9BACI|nr:DUF4652 domain-containing protein [Vulcanibacillus modesticaldus]OEF99902.1 hypothetical protein BHF71_07260 [Vulcanibacillus modesticaldus]
MTLRNVMLLTGLLFILSGCSINSTDNDIDNSKEYIKTDNYSKMINNGSNKNDELSSVKDSVETEKVDITNFEKIAQLNNGEELYYGYYETSYGKYIVIKRNSDIKVISKGFPSRPKVSPNGKMVAFIDDLDFEMIGNLFIYDTVSKNKIKLTNYNYKQENTVKALEWLDDDHILLIIGFGYGTITRGGDLYIYDLNKEELEKILDAGERREIVDVKVKEADLKLTIVVWTDDNYTEYEYIEKMVPIKELIKK